MAYPQSNSVNEYLMGALPNLVNTGGYIPSNQTMSFALNQPKSLVPSNLTQFDGSMNLVGDNKPFNWNPPTTNGGIPMTCLLYTSPSPRDGLLSRMPSSA